MALSQSTIVPSHHCQLSVKYFAVNGAFYRMVDQRSLLCYTAQMSGLKPSKMERKYALTSEKHSISSLMHRLHLNLVTLGLDYHITCWLSNYLANRSQSVVNVGNGSLSDQVSGVPQGSILGPLLLPRVYIMSTCLLIVSCSTI